MRRVEWATVPEIHKGEDRESHRLEPYSQDIGTNVDLKVMCSGKTQNTNSEENYLNRRRYVRCNQSQYKQCLNYTIYHSKGKRENLRKEKAPMHSITDV